MLLVGGEGTRLRPLTFRRPKALLPLLNQPLLSHELCLLARHGVTDIVLAVGYRADALRAALGDGSRWGVRLTYVEDPAPLGTAGAIKNAQPHLPGPFIAMNGDLVYDVDVATVARAHLDAGALITFCLRRVADISRYGLIQFDDRGRVTAFKEKQTEDETGRNTVTSGLYVMSPEVFDRIPAGCEFSNELDLFPGLLRAGKALCAHVPAGEGYWADVGTVESYLQTTRDLLEGAVPWCGPQVAPDVRLGDGAEVRGPVHIAPGVVIEAGAVVGPHVTLGAGCRIGSRAHVVASVLWEGVAVGEGAEVSASVLADGVRVPAGANHFQEALVP